MDEDVPGANTENKVEKKPHRKISIVIPALNEEENIEETVEKSLAALQKYTDDYEVVVIDDGSSDRTGEIMDRLAADDPAVKVIHHERNRGCHPSTLTGFRHATGDVVFFIPGDGQISPEELRQVLPAAEEADVVYTWRKKRADPAFRIFANRSYHVIIRYFLGVRFHDVDSASLFHKKVLDAVLDDVDGKSAFVAAELLLRAREKGFTATEVQIDHYPRLKGRARGINLRDTFVVPWDLVRLFWRLRSIRAAPPGGQPAARAGTPPGGRRAEGEPSSESVSTEEVPTDAKSHSGS